MTMPTRLRSEPSSPATQSPWRYDNLAIALHWVMALMLVFMAGLGWYMLANEEEPGIQWHFDLHRSIGIVIGLLIVVRIAWRLMHRPAALPASLPAWQVRLANGAQWLLYLLIVMMVVTGYLGSSFTRSGVAFFGLPTPHWAIPNRAWAHQFFDIHSALIWVLVAVVAVHALGALKHLLLDKDGVFQRMWFARRR